MHEIRRAAVAGSWYPGTAARLREVLDAYLADVPATEEPAPRALVAPHAGLMYSGPVAAYAYSLVRGARIAAVVLVGPSHFVGFDGASIWPRGAWDTPFGPIPVEESLAADIARTPIVHEHAAAHQREHSLELQLPFVGRLLPGVPIVPIVMGHQTRATAQELGRAIADAVRDLNVLLVASSDLSHYHDARTAAALDGVVLRHVEAMNAEGLMDALEADPGHACGGGPMVAVLDAARRLGASRARVLRYADSGDVSGDKTSVVGYMAAGIW